MAESRNVRLYIYNDNHQKGKGLSLIESQTFQLEDKKNVYTEKSESVDPSTGAKILTEKTTTNVCSFDVILTKLEYKKNVYEPCQILTNLQVGVVQHRTDVKTHVTTTYTNGTKNVEEKTDEGDFKPAEMIDSEKINLLKGASVELEIDNTKVAQNYFVYKVRSSYSTVSGKTSLFVELTIFSRDKLMTLDKYSRAYTARKLYTDILSEEAKKFSSVEVANHMQLLKYQDSSTKATSRDELRIPYLVQYNESFYQFMVRSANRFGEFLFFEDGQLNLGMQPSEKNYYKRNDKGEIEKKDGADIIIDWATEPNAVQNRYYESVVSEGISVEERGHSYLDHKPEYEDAYGSSGGRYNPDPTSANEWTDQDLEKNKYIEFEEALLEEVKCMVIESIFKGLESQTLGEAITTISMEMSKKIYDIHRNNQDYNNVLDEANYDLIENEDQKSGENYKQFVTYKGSSNLSSNLKNMFDESGLNNFFDLFYQFIRKKEKEVGEQAVWLDFGNYYRPIKLGDKLRVANKDYVAISVEGSYENGQEHLLVSAIPVFSIAETESSPQTVTTAYDPWTTSCPFPPALPDIIIREARPQVAFVAENLDPGTLGRIRVRYPWQDAEGDMSPWIRVTLPLATDGGAVNFTPNVGDEVMVGYVHGNIEHPYGMGYLTAPFVNERWKNAIPLDQYGGVHGIKVKTGHHLTFSDGANGACLVASTLGPLNFAKSFWPTGAVGAWPMGDEKSADFGGGFELSDRYGFYKITGSTDDRNITIESPVGTVNLNAFQGISIEAPNGEIEIKGKNVSIEASNRLNIKSGENIEKKLWYQNSVKDVFKAAFVPELEAARDTVVSKTVGEFFDMSFLRCVVEWFLVPVNGTLNIKSSTFVTIEAGEGKTEVPADSLRYGKGYDSTANIKDKESLANVPTTVTLIAKNVNALVDDIHAKYDAVCEATAAFNKLVPQSNNADEMVISYKTVIKKDEAFTEDDTDFNWENVNLKKVGEEKLLADIEEEARDEDGKVDTGKLVNLLLENNRIVNDHWRISKKRKPIVEVSEALRKAATNLENAVLKLTTLDTLNFNIYQYDSKKVEASDAVNIIKTLEFPNTISSMTLTVLKGKTYGKEIMKYSNSFWDFQKKAMSRYAVYNYLKDLSSIDSSSSKINSEIDTLNNDNWNEFVKSLNMPSKYTTKIEAAASFVNEHFNPFSGFIDDQAQWANGFEGKILMSDSANRTASFDENQNLTYTKNRNFYEENLKELRNELKKI
ncbi:MAG: hypothetical protein IKN58_07595 [Prevotella sp.]|nr:hypothetical protein [Prevotella sp.]